jgi:hypothetical protein
MPHHADDELRRNLVATFATWRNLVAAFATLRHDVEMLERSMIGLLDGLQETDVTDPEAEPKCQN